jgi:hypothetical protein
LLLLGFQLNQVMSTLKPSGKKNASVTNNKRIWIAMVQPPL